MVSSFFLVWRLLMKNHTWRSHYYNCQKWPENWQKHKTLWLWIEWHFNTHRSSKTGVFMTNLTFVFIWLTWCWKKSATKLTWFTLAVHAKILQFIQLWHCINLDLTCIMPGYMVTISNMNNIQLFTCEISQKMHNSYDKIGIYISILFWYRASVYVMCFKPLWWLIVPNINMSHWSISHISLPTYMFLNSGYKCYILAHSQGYMHQVPTVVDYCAKYAQNQPFLFRDIITNT